jgi:hypothetical protein
MQGPDPRIWPVTEASEVRRFFGELGKHVIYFAGYGELGYEDRDLVRRTTLDVLRKWSPAEVVVHSGTLLRTGGHDGIAEVYAVAKELGVTSTGIHPSVAMDFADTHRVSPHCEHVFFVDDQTWGGFLEANANPSPTLRLHLEVSDELVLVGGGKHAAAELMAFESIGADVRYVPADMNHATTLEWSHRSGADIRDLRGAAYDVWEKIRRSRDGK